MTQTRISFTVVPIIYTLTICDNRASLTAVHNENFFKWRIYFTDISATYHGLDIRTMLALLEDYQRQNRLGINEMIKFPQAYAIEKDTVTINYDCLTIELRFCFDSEGIITSQRYPTGEIITCK